MGIASTIGTTTHMYWSTPWEYQVAQTARSMAATPAKTPRRDDLTSLIQ